MGHSQAAKAQTRDRIVQTAAARIREAGIDGVGVADLMKEAGLTHGGFYRHFGSREELLNEAVALALEDGGQHVANTIASGGEAPLAALVDAYLSAAHRDSLASSCAVTTLATDVARSSPDARSAYTRQVQRYLELIAGAMVTSNRKDARRQAVAALCSLVGAVSLARAVADEQLSREILKSAGDAVKSQFG
ncbi:MAG: TetR/AcrR family transcriptional regulator [Betaproteobacteria bacterium]